MTSSWAGGGLGGNTLRTFSSIYFRRTQQRKWDAGIALPPPLQRLSPDCCKENWGKGLQISIIQVSYFKNDKKCTLSSSSGSTPTRKHNMAVTSQVPTSESWFQLCFCHGSSAYLPVPRFPACKRGEWPHWCRDSVGSCPAVGSLLCEGKVFKFEPAESSKVSLSVKQWDRAAPL